MHTYPIRSPAASPPQLSLPDMRLMWVFSAPVSQSGGSFVPLYVHIMLLPSTDVFWNTTRSRARGTQAKRASPSASPELGRCLLCRSQPRSHTSSSDHGAQPTAVARRSHTPPVAPSVAPPRRRYTQAFLVRSARSQRWSARRRTCGVASASKTPSSPLPGLHASP